MEFILKKQKEEWLGDQQMPDYITVFLTGISTGLAIIFAQRLVNWLDKHYMVRLVKKALDEITFNKKSDERTK